MQIIYDSYAQGMQTGMNYIIIKVFNNNYLENWVCKGMYGEDILAF